MDWYGSHGGQLLHSLISNHSPLWKSTTTTALSQSFVDFARLVRNGVVHKQKLQIDLGLAHAVLFKYGVGIDVPDPVLGLSPALIKHGSLFL